jgi:hypothetical protein
LQEVILDSGALLGIASDDQRCLAIAKWARRNGFPLVIPAVVVAETVRGGPSDARINSALKEARQVATTPRQGRCAGALLAKANGPSTVDALVMARALLSGGPATIATSDKGDFDQLLSIAGDIDRLRSGAARVTVVPV